MSVLRRSHTEMHFRLMYSVSGVPRVRDSVRSWVRAGGVAVPYLVVVGW